MNSFRALVPCSALLLAPVAMMAHDGDAHAHGFVAGFAHPWTGLDHLIAMIAVGILAMRLATAAASRQTAANGEPARHRGYLLLPVSFITALAAGAGLGLAGIALPFQEMLVAASIIVIGAVLAVSSRLAVALPVIMAAGMIHGLAHGAELEASALLGMVAASAALHALGLGTGLLAASVRLPHWYRYAGAATIIGGMAAVGAVLI